MDPAPTLLYDLLRDSARRLPDKVALACGERRLTYAEIDRGSDAVAAGLARAGVRRGDRVIVFAPNGVEAVVSFWAVLKADATVCMVNAQTPAPKLAFYLDHTRARAAIVDESLAARFSDAAERASHQATMLVAHASAVAAEAPAPRRNIESDLAAVIYTSGSRGEPRGVMLSHRNMLAACDSISAYLGLAEDDVILCALPLAFDYGLYQMILAFAVGARLVLEPSFTLVPQVVARMERERVTVLPAMPTIVALLERMGTLGSHDLSSVRCVTSSGAALAERQIRWMQRTFPRARIFSMYGLTECKRCTYLPPEDIDRKPGSVGIAIPNTELWIVDAEGRAVPPGEPGELVIRGPHVMLGYWEDPVATARSLKPGPLPGERVLHTGDICRLDEEGYLYFISRSDDVIKCRGQKIAPREVELALAAVAGVREAAVIGVEDEVQGHAVKAFVVVDRGAFLSEALLRDECHRRLEPGLVPKFIELVADLPKGPTGKVDKLALAGGRHECRAV
jgi:amino acid adenylation domain-containing protein